MNNEEYKEIVDRILPKKIKIKKLVISFFIGGLIGLIGQLLMFFYSKFDFITNKDAGNYMMVTLIFISSLLTGLGYMDELIEKFGAGLIIPITGFAHSTTSSAMEYKKEGLVFGIGSNIFKLSGSVILYGIISSFIVSIIKIIFFGG